MWDLRTTTGFQPDFEQQPRLGSFWTGRGTFLRQFSIWDDPFYGLSHLFHGMVRNMRNHSYPPIRSGLFAGFFWSQGTFWWWRCSLSLGIPWHPMAEDPLMTYRWFPYDVRGKLTVRPRKHPPFWVVSLCFTMFHSSDPRFFMPSSCWVVPYDLPEAGAAIDISILPGAALGDRVSISEHMGKWW